jgi:hypothetical protein
MDPTAVAIMIGYGLAFAVFGGIMLLAYFLG